MAKLKSLEEMTLKELQVEITSMGYGNLADTLSTKKQAVEVYTALKATPAKDPEVPQSEGPAPVEPSPIENRQDTKKWQTKADRMKEHLDAQPKVQVYLAPEGKEQPGQIREIMVGNKIVVQTSGSVEVVTLNGYSTYIPKGTPTLVPQQVAEILGQAQVDTAKAGREIDINRPDVEHPETPYGTVRGALE